MSVFEKIVFVIFNIALFLNGLLIFIQAFKIFNRKTAAGVSFVTFLGFAFIQVATVFHGYFKNDMQLTLGMCFSLIPTVLVLVLILRYR